MPGFKDDARYSKGRKAAKVIGLMMAGAALVGCNTAEARPAETTSQLPPTPDKPNPSSTESNTVEKWLPKQGDYLSAEKIGELDGDYDKLVQAFTINQSDYSSFEELARLHSYVDTSYLRSGTSAAELANQDIAPVDYDSYVSGMYAAPFAEATSYDNAIDNNLDNNHGLIAKYYLATRMAEGDVPYVFDQQVLSVVETTGEIDDKTCSFTYLAQRSDNMDKTILAEANGQPMGDKIKVTVTVHRMDDGTIKSETHWGATEE